LRERTYNKLQKIAGLSRRVGAVRIWQYSIPQWMAVNTGLLAAMLKQTGNLMRSEEPSKAFAGRCMRRTPRARSLLSVLGELD